jgi:hypothetical protein
VRSTLGRANSQGARAQRLLVRWNQYFRELAHFSPVAFWSSSPSAGLILPFLRALSLRYGMDRTLALREFPEVYDDVKPTIDYTVQKKEALQRYLDEPPTDRQVQAIRRRK